MRFEYERETDSLYLRLAADHHEISTSGEFAPGIVAARESPDQSQDGNDRQSSRSAVFVNRLYRLVMLFS